MIKLNNDFLNDVGLGSLSEADKDKVLSHLYDTLEARVGMRLADKLTETQLKQFEKMSANSPQAAVDWLADLLPDYKDVVSEEFEKLKQETKTEASDILQQIAS